jgi:hypothetical protein
LNATQRFEHFSTGSAKIFFLAFPCSMRAGTFESSQPTWSDNASS